MIDTRRFGEQDWAYKLRQTISGVNGRRNLGWKFTGQALLFIYADDWEVSNGRTTKALSAENNWQNESV